jgi:phosphoenolpyruvate carboxykinase (ATP)
MKIEYTRTMLRAALGGRLDAVNYHRDQVFNLDIPESCPGVPAGILNPRSTWDNPAAYDQQALRLARMFTENFKEFDSSVTAEVLAAGPNV